MMLRRKHIDRTWRSLTVAALLLGVLSMSSMGAIAQEATPSAPGASDCTVEPRTEADILSIVEPHGTPIPYEDRSSDELKDVTLVGPADFATQQAIRETLLQFVACGNADLPLSVYALYTDDFLLNQVDGETFRHPSDEETPPLTLLDVQSIQMLSDGHAFAVALVASEEFPIVAVGVYLEEGGGHWLLDSAA